MPNADESNIMFFKSIEEFHCWWPFQVGRDSFQTLELHECSIFGSYRRWQFSIIFMQKEEKGLQEFNLANINVIIVKYFSFCCLLDPVFVLFPFCFFFSLNFAIVNDHPNSMVAKLKSHLVIASACHSFKVGSYLILLCESTSDTCFDLIASFVNLQLMILIFL